MNHAELCRQLFTGLAADDKAATEAACAATLKATQNGAPAMGLADLQAFNHAVHKVVPDFHYEDCVCHVTDTGFVEEHRVCGTLPDGSALNLFACVVGDVEDGKIVALREYVDGFAARGLLKALQG
jgi:ketosteroid isomerase-like protein